MRQFQAACAAIVLCVAMPAFAQSPAPAPAAAAAPDLSWQDKLQRQTGVVTLLGSGAKLNLGQDYYFLNAADSKKVLVDGWGNPPDSANGVLGMIFPSRFKPLDENAWGAVVSYEDTGYVADKDARDTDYDKLLNDLRKTEDGDNKARQEAGSARSIWWVGPSGRPTMRRAMWSSGRAT